MLSLLKSKLNEFFELVAKETLVYLPVDNSSGQASYQKWKEGVVYSSALNTVRSAKDFFFPQMENLMDFKMQGKSVEVVDTRVEKEDFVIFGVRACDVASFSILDKVFLADPVDTYYQNRRDHAVIISMACSKPESTCFCPLYGIDATKPEGDLSAWETEDRIFFKANTQKGEVLLNNASRLLEESEGQIVEVQRETTKKILEELPFAHLDLSKFKGENLMELFNSPKWAELSQSCLGCGTCTFVCPTCQCFDIKDFDTGHGVKRFRCWDSCMYSEFTKMAAANPRLTQLERFRQRFMHKLVYFPDNNEGTYGCVGCGRCLIKCPVSMNIVKVIKQLGEE
ncbi:MAG: 4Fe-4S dicluster domain-containing protein [Sphaerochaetaceae bacterium]